jgi:hypothetical protein
MICYKDRDFCEAGALCSVSSQDCGRRLTLADAVRARQMGLDIAVMDFTKAPCFKPFFMMPEEGKPDRPVRQKKSIRAEAIRRAKNYMALKDVGNNKGAKR